MSGIDVVVLIICAIMAMVVVASRIEFDDDEVEK